MPLYEYQCQDCGSQFEKMARFSEVHLPPECPECHGRQTQKQISVFAMAGGTSAANGSSLSSSNCGTGGRFT